MRAAMNPEREKSDRVHDARSSIAQESLVPQMFLEFMHDAHHARMMCARAARTASEALSWTLSLAFWQSKNFHR
jgi:hypothetical protein